jgi:hypothetical protein
MAAEDLKVRLALGIVMGVLVAGCANRQRCGGPAVPAAADNQGDPMARCNAHRVSAKVIVVAVEGLEMENAGRIGDALAQRYQAGFVGIAPDPRNKLITILTKVDSEADAAQALEIVRGLGFVAREASEEDHKTAQAALASIELTFPSNGSPGEKTDSAPKDSADPGIQSLGTSLDPLRNRFNADKAKLRFIALLSPT